MGEFFSTLLDSREIITTGGLFLILAIVFAENGLFFGFFLPGDYLLFSAGLLCGTDVIDVNIWVMVFSITLAAYTGSYTGYYFGKILGQNLYKKKENLFFKYKYLVKTRFYYMKYGGKTLIISRFLPVVRTFAPILAGAVRMNFKKFSFYNLWGSIIWVFSLVLLGYFLGQQFPQIMDYLHYIIIGFLVVTSTIVIKGLLNFKKQTARKIPALKRKTVVKVEEESKPKANKGVISENLK
ncbi:MAG TPA: DedA family protein [Cytophagales bacterium]|nr:DedA family protein [Cytophagales bacterium]